MSGRPVIFVDFFRGKWTVGECQGGWGGWVSGGFDFFFHDMSTGFFALLLVFKWSEMYGSTEYGNRLSFSNRYSNWDLRRCSMCNEES